MHSFGFSLFAALLPQIFLAALAIVIAVLGVLRPRQRPDLHRWIAVIALLAAVTASSILLWNLRSNPSGTAISLWSGGLVVDRLALFVTITACVAGLLTCLLVDTYLARVRTRSAAFFALLLMATAATSVAGSQRNMLTLFIALQLLTLSLAGIAAVLKTDTSGVRAAWQLLVEGAIGGGLLLYGMALVYGATGSSDFASVPGAVARGPGVATLGATLVLFGLTFPLGILPLRRWVERTADTIPAAPAAFVTVMAMTAGAAALLRIDGAGLHAVLHPVVGVGTWVATLALAGAAVAALRATRLTTLVAAGASAQSALLLVSIVSVGGSSGASAATLFAIAVFGLSTIACFGVIAMLQNAGLQPTVADLRGLGRRSPAAAVFLAFALATLAGVPPLGGFVARLLIVIAAMGAGEGWLAVVVLATAVVTAVPMVRLIAGMWAEPRDEHPFTLLATPRLGRMAAAFCCLGAFYLTVLAEPLLLLARGSAGTLR